MVSVALCSILETLVNGRFRVKLADTPSAFSSFWLVHLVSSGRHSYLDKVRGVLNEGGLYGERMGWHLPGFDTSSWALRDLSEGLPNAAAGVGFFVTTFNLSIPDGFDVPMSFMFDDTSQPYRSQLYVNGWMMGKRVSNLGYAWYNVSYKPG